LFDLSIQRQSAKLEVGYGSGQVERMSKFYEFGLLSMEIVNASLRRLGSGFAAVFL
jgi:hypothetical protein